MLAWKIYDKIMGFIVGFMLKNYGFLLFCN